MTPPTGDEFDFLNQNFLDSEALNVPAPTPVSVPGGRKRHKVPERDKLFAAQKNVHKSLMRLRGVEHSLHSNKIVGRDLDDLRHEMLRLEDHLQRAYKQLRTYLQDHTEAR